MKSSGKNQSRPAAGVSLRALGFASASRPARAVGFARAITFALLLLALSLLCCASALGARPHEFTTEFATPCAAQPCEGGTLKRPNGVAVSEGSADVYVVDEGANRVVRFNGAGVFQSEVTGPNATGTATLTEGSATIESALASTGAFSVGEELTAPGIPPGTKITAIPSPGTLEASSPVEAGKSAIGVELSAAQRFEAPTTIAIDNSCALRGLSEPKCKEEDPSNGDFYVVDGGEANPKEHRVVDKFTATGAYLGQISEFSGSKFQEEELDGVAVDLSGDVWVYRERPEIDGFTNAEPNTPTTSILPNSLGGGFARPGFAVDSKGNFYGRLLSNVVPQIVKWNHAGTLLSEALGGEGASAVGVDQRSNAAFIDKGKSVEAFNPEGGLVESLGQEHGEAHLSEGTGIGVNAASGSLYVADAATGKIVVFGPSQPSTPKIEAESFAEVGADSASIAAEINLRSEAGEAPTTYRFQYGRCTSASTCASSGYEASAPEPEGQIAADFEAHTVSVKLEGLQPSSTYHFRALARNSHGEGAPGEEETFTTEGLGGQLSLPDNRGDELVSPPDKLGSLIEPISEYGVVQVAASGGAITYLANAPTEAAPQGYTNQAQVLSRRSAAAWSSRDIAIAHSGPTGFTFGVGPEYKLFDPELKNSIVQPLGEFNPGLSEEASESTAYLRDLGETCGTHCFHPLVTGKAGFANVPEGTSFGEKELCESTVIHKAREACGPEALGATEDLSHVVLGTLAELQPGAVPGELYEWSGGALSQVSILPGPGGEGTEAALGLGNQAARGAISSDGSRIAWAAKQNLYERDMTRGESVQLDAAQEGCGGCESGAGRFQFANAEGTRIYFTDERRLTGDSGANPGAEHPPADLYECRVGLQAGKLHCALTDLTPKHGAEGAEVLGGILGASEDGEYLYFVAKGVLSEAANGRGQKAQAGQPNLYERQGAETSYMATLSGGDESDWNEELQKQPTRVSGDGRFLELMSQAPLTGYDNRDRESGKPTAEVYLYDATSKRLSCASCEPSGVRPWGVEYHQLEPGNGGLAGGGKGAWTPTALVAANVPGWTAIASGNKLKSRYQPRYLNDEGRLFFNSADALVPQDANGTQDVYQYEPPGVGDCSESSGTYSARSGGCVALISSGSSPQESAFMDASESGDDVFFLTSAKLSKLDVDASRDVYDAHVCTSAEPCISFPDVQSPPCTNEASCKASPTPQPAIFGAPASATFEGAGNTLQAPAPVKPKTAEQIRIEKLGKALKACRARKSKQKRKSCEKAARKRYGKPKAKAKAKAKRKRKGKK